MATFTKFQGFVEHLADGVHNLSTDTLKIALSNSDPAASLSTANTFIASVSEVSYDNCSDRACTQTTHAQSGGTFKLVITDLVLTASGAVGPFRYVVLFDDTVANDPLIGYMDYGSSITLESDETFTINFDDANGVLTIA